MRITIWLVGASLVAACATTVWMVRDKEMRSAPVHGADLVDGSQAGHESSGLAGSALSQDRKTLDTIPHVDSEQGAEVLAPGTDEDWLKAVPIYDGTNLGFEDKYSGKTPEELLEINPVIRRYYREDLFRYTDLAIEIGDFSVEMIEAGGSLDFSKYQDPDDALAVVGYRSERMADGGHIYKVASLSREKYPEMYARAMELSWVHYQVRQAGICPCCSKKETATGESQQ